MRRYMWKEMPGIYALQVCPNNCMKALLAELKIVAHVLEMWSSSCLWDQWDRSFKNPFYKITVVMAFVRKHPAQNYLK